MESNDHHAQKSTSMMMLIHQKSVANLNARINAHATVVNLNQSSLAAQQPEARLGAGVLQGVVHHEGIAAGLGNFLEPRLQVSSNRSTSTSVHEILPRN